MSAARSTGLPLVVLAGLSWGTGGLAGAALAERAGLSTPAVAFLRLAVAAVLALGWLLVTRGPSVLRVAGRDRGRVVAVGVLLAVFQACYFAAVAQLGLGVATLVTLGLAPVLVSVATTVTERAAPSRRTLAALALAVVGLALVVLGPGAGPAGGDVGLGLLAAGVSSTGFAALTLVVRSLGGRVAPAATTTLGFVVGAVVLAPLALVTGPVLPPATAGDLGLVLYLGLVPTALAYGAYAAGLVRVRATTASLAALLEPVTAAVLAALVLDEQLGVLGVVGAAAVLVAILLG